MTTQRPGLIPDGTFELNGNTWMHTADGGMMPVELIKPADRLKDETVRTILDFGIDLSERVRRFVGHTFADIGALEALLAEQYKVRLGGKKGNIRLYSYDGLYKVEVRVRDLLDFGPELRIAKNLFDECLNEWSADSPPELRAIVTRAFNTDKAGQVNRAEIFTLLRTESADARWQEAQRALRDAIIVIGSKTALYLWFRDRFDAEFQSVTVNLAKA